MDPNIANLPPGDPKLINSIGNRLKSQGLFDQFRKHCLADIDTKPAYQNLRQRVEGYVNNFLQSQQWRPDLNKNQLRDSLRRHINESGMLAIGVDRIVEQVVNPKVYQVFYPQIESVVFKLLGKDLPASGSFMQKCLDNNAVDPTNPEVPGEEKPNIKEESGQETLQKIIGFTDDTSNTSASLPSASTTDQTTDLVEIKSTDTPIKVEPDSGVPMKASVETQTDITPNSESTSKDGLTTDSSYSDDGKESSDTKKRSSFHDEKKDHHKKSVESQKVKSKDVKKDEKKGDKSKSDKIKHSNTKHKVDSKIQSDTKNKTEDGAVKTKKVEGKVLEKEKSKSSSSQDSKSPKHKLGDKSKSEQRMSSKSGDSSKSMKSSSKPKDVKLPKVIKLEKSSSSESEGKSGDKSKKSEGSKSEKSKEHKKVEKSKSDSHLKHKSSDENKSKVVKTEKVKSETKNPEKSSEGKSGEKSKPKEKDKIKMESHSKDTSKSHGDKSKSLPDKNKLHEKIKSADASKSKSVDAKITEKPKESKPKTTEQPKEKEKSESEGKHKTSEKSTKKTEKEKSGKIVSKTTSSCSQKSEHSSKFEEKTEKYEKKFKKIKVDEKDKIDSSSPEKKSMKRKHSESGDKPEKKLKISRIEDVKPSSSKTIDVEDDEKEKIEPGNWSDVTVSSVHTSDLSDYDDHISLTDSEIDNTKGGSSALSSKSPSPVKRPRGRPRKDQSQAQQQIRKQKIVKTPTYGNQKDRDPKFVLPKYNEDVTPNVDEPRRELRRQRKVNPRYSNDEFASIFSKGKDKLQFQHDEQEEHRFGGTPKDSSRVTPDRDECPPTPKLYSRSRKSTVSSVTSDHVDTDQPYSPRSDISEMETPSRRHSKDRESGGRPLSPKSDMSADSAHLQGPRTPESTCSTESKRRQHYDSSDLYKPRPTIRGGRRNRGSDQRYDDSDLYKPRPQFTSSRRARGISPTRNLENSLPSIRQQQKITLSPEFSPEARSAIGSPVESTATTPSSDKTLDESKDLQPIAFEDDDFKDGNSDDDDDEETNSSSEQSAKRRRISLSAENVVEPKRRGAPRGRRRKSAEMSTRGRKPMGRFR